MSYEHKANTGTLFSNNNKTEDKHPNYKGKINVGGKDYELAGWVKEGKNGQFLSLKVSELFKPEPQNTSEKIANASGLPF